MVRMRSPVRSRQLAYHLILLWQDFFLFQKYLDTKVFYGRIDNGNRNEHGLWAVQKWWAFSFAGIFRPSFAVDVWLLSVLADCEKPSHPDVGTSTKSKISDLPHVLLCVVYAFCILVNWTRLRHFAKRFSLPRCSSIFVSFPILLCVAHAFVS